MGNENIKDREASQVFNLKEENSSVDITSTSSAIKEIPTVSTLLQRKKYSNPSESELNVVLEQPATFHMESEVVDHPKEISQSGLMNATPSLVTPSIPSQPARPTNQKSTKSIRLQQPPIFKKTLLLERLSIDLLAKRLRRNRKKSQILKLDILGYFSTLFSEVTYFEFSSQQMAGVLGYGSAELVAMTRGVIVNSTQAPSLTTMISSGRSFVGPMNSLREEDLRQLRALGFKGNVTLGVFPVCTRKMLFGFIPLNKKVEVQGAWICACDNALNIDEKSKSKLRRLFTNLRV